MNLNNTKHSEDLIIDKAQAENSENYEDYKEHIKNLLDVIDRLDDLVTKWKGDYDNLQSELKDLQNSIEST